MEYILKYFSDFTEAQIEQLKALRTLYSEWNEKINIISRKDIEHLYLKHILHSLSIAATFDFKDGSSIIDIGTGGGFPGIPLAIYFPNIHFHLVDSIGKKLKVVQEIADVIQLRNISAEHKRAEEIKDRKFDFVVSRAVAPLKDLWKWSKPLLSKKNNNTFNNGLICLKGGDLHQEISESGLRPGMISLYEIFSEEYFKEKYLLYVKP
ncbi:MAG: 16S rRNA (guanine(527)-N(7))-methyltransferase RsmG [Bacteroidetes bacterium]|nr:16S rRNA (guanine(527)-N(7))-methyltransferase RsmG [Bacteroidota bacterium]